VAPYRQPDLLAARQRHRAAGLGDQHLQQPIGHRRQFGVQPVEQRAQPAR
jgi:hypothetical protein